MDRAIKEQEAALSIGLRPGTHPAHIILPEVVVPTMRAPKSSFGSWISELDEFADEIKELLPIPPVSEIPPPPEEPVATPPPPTPPPISPTCFPRCFVQLKLSLVDDLLSSFRIPATQMLQSIFGLYVDHPIPHHAFLLPLAWSQYASSSRSSLPPFYELFFSSFISSFLSLLLSYPVP